MEECEQKVVLLIQLSWQLNLKLVEKKRKKVYLETHNPSVNVPVKGIRLRGLCVLPHHKTQGFADDATLKQWHS